MLLASYFALPSSCCLIDPLIRDHGPFMSLDFYHCGNSSFLCWVQGLIERLEHKTLFHGTSTIHLWTPCYAWTTDPKRDTGASSFRNIILIPNTLFPRSQAFHGTQKLFFWQRLFPFITLPDFVIFGTSVGFMLVSEKTLWFKRKKKDESGQTKPIKHLEDLIML